MTPRNALILSVLAVIALVAGWRFGPATLPSGTTQLVAPGTLVFIGLAPKLQQAQTVEISRGAQKLVMTRTGDRWGLADRGNYPVQQDRLRELMTGLTELRITEPRTADPAQYDRLGVGDPASPTGTANLVRVLDKDGKPLAELIVGHRRVRTQGNVPESLYMRRPGEAQSYLAEGRVPVDADPQLWVERDIANISAKTVKSVLVTRGDATLSFARDGDKFALTTPAEHPKLDDYRVEDVFRAFETLTLTDVKPAASGTPGEKVGTAAYVLDDGTKIDVTVFRTGAADKPDIWIQLAVSGDSEQAKALSARVTGWSYQVGSWKERAFVPTLDDLKATEPDKPATQ